MFQCDQCDEFPYETAEELDDHLQRHSSGTLNRFQRVSNGFGGTTTVKVNLSASQGPRNTATEKQVTFIRSLLTERKDMPEAEAIRNLLNTHRVAGTLDKKVASNAITQLLAVKVPNTEQAGTTATIPNVPEGRYAFTNEEGNTAFCRISHGKGSWAGRTFVELLVGSPGSLREVKISKAAQSTIAGKVAEDPKAAMIRFGLELGYCGRCGSPLTDPHSIAAGIGPVCAGKL